jgi:CBS domain-containing protein
MHGGLPIHGSMATIEPLVRRDFKTVDKRDELRSVLGWIRGDSTKLPIVVDDGKPYGIVNERALMSRRLDDNAKLEGYTLMTRALRSDASVEQARDRMRELRAAFLPVEDARGKLAGYVSSLDVARALDVQRTARELALPVASLREGHTMGEALHAFTQEYVDFLPVMGDGGERVSGVLPRRTLLAMETHAGSRGRKDAGGERTHILNDPVSGFMDEPLARVPASMDFATLLRTLEQNGYAIVEEPGGRMVGLVTPETLLRAQRT